MPEEENQLLAEFGLVPDFELGVDAQPHDEPNHLRGVEPPKPIALLTNRKVVLRIAVPAKSVRYDVIGLPPLADPPAAHVAGPARLAKHA